MNKERKGYPSDISDEEWSFCVNYLTLMKEDAPQREHSFASAAFNALAFDSGQRGRGCCPTSAVEGGL